MNQWEPLYLICDIAEYMHKRGLEGSEITVDDLLNRLSKEQDEIDHQRKEYETLQDTHNYPWEE